MTFRTTLPALQPCSLDNRAVRDSAEFSHFESSVLGSRARLDWPEPVHLSVPWQPSLVGEKLPAQCSDYEEDSMSFGPRPSTADPKLQRDWFRKTRPYVKLPQHLLSESQESKARRSKSPATYSKFPKPQDGKSQHGPEATESTNQDEGGFRISFRNRFRSKSPHDTGRELSSQNEENEVYDSRPGRSKSRSPSGGRRQTPSPQRGSGSPQRWAGSQSPGYIPPPAALKAQRRHDLEDEGFESMPGRSKSRSPQRNRRRTPPAQRERGSPQRWAGTQSPSHTPLPAAVVAQPGQSGRQGKSRSPGGLYTSPVQDRFQGDGTRTHLQEKAVRQAHKHTHRYEPYKYQDQPDKADFSGTARQPHARDLPMDDGRGSLYDNVDYTSEPKRRDVYSEAVHYSAKKTLGDTLAEKNKQVAELKKTLEDTLAEKDIQIAELQQDKDEADRERWRLQQDVDDKDKQLSSLQQGAERREKELLRLQQDRDKADKERRRLQQDVDDKDRQLSSLLQQAERREEELSRLQLTLQNRVKFEKLQEGKKTRKEDFERQTRQMAAKDAELARLQQKLSQLQQERKSALSTLQQQEDRSATTLSRLQQDRDEADSERWRLQQEVDSKNRQLSSLQRKVERREQELSRLQYQTLQARESEMAQPTREMEELRQEAESAGQLRQQVTTMQREMAEKNAELSQLQQEVSRLQRERDSAFSTLQQQDSSHSTLSRLQQDRDKADRERWRLQQEVDNKDNQVSSLQQQVKSMEQELSRLQALQTREPEVAQLNEELAELRREVERADHLRSQLAAKERELEELRLEAETAGELQQQVAAMQRKMALKDAKVSRLQQELDAALSTLQQQEDRSGSTLSRLQQFRDEADRERWRLQQEMDNKDLQLSSLQQEMKRRDQEQSHLQQALQTRELEMAQLNRELEELRLGAEAAGQLQQQLATMEREMTGKDTKVSRLQQEVSQLHQGLSRLQQDWSQLEQERDSALSALQQQEDRDDSTLSHLKQDRDKTDRERRRLQQELDNKDRQLSSLQQQVKSREGDVSRLNQALQTRESEMTQLNGELVEVRRKMETTGHLHSQLAAKEEEARNLRRQLEAANQQQQQMASRQREMETSEFAARKELEEKEARLSAVERQLQEGGGHRQRQITALENEVHKLKEELQSKEDSEEKYEEKLACVKEITDAARAENERLKKKLEESKRGAEGADQVQRQMAAMEDLKRKYAELERKNQDLLQRLSSMASERMRQDNACVEDLSDPVRHSVVVTKWQALMNGEYWTLFEVVQGHVKDEAQIAGLLYYVFQKIFSLIQTELDRFEQLPWEQLTTGDEQEESRLQSQTVFTKYLTTEEFRALLRACVAENPQFRFLPPSELRRVFSAGSKKFLKKKQLPPQFVQDFHEEMKQWDLKGVPLQACHKFADEVLRLCFLMALQSPPMALVFDRPEGKEMDALLYEPDGDRNRRRPWIVKYVILPPLLRHQNGPVLHKGIVELK